LGSQKKNKDWPGKTPTRVPGESVRKSGAPVRMRRESHPLTGGALSGKGGGRGVVILPARVLEKKKISPEKLFRREKRCLRRGRGERRLAASVVPWSRE